jgi:hypothetical protein
MRVLQLPSVVLVKCFLITVAGRAVGNNSNQPAVKSGGGRVLQLPLLGSRWREPAVKNKVDEKKKTLM